MRLNHIVCASKNWVIGRDGDMPWHLPEDLKYFKKTTMGCPVIMGRKTFDSIGRALPGRLNIVLTRDESYVPAEGVTATSNMDDAIAIAKKHLERSDAPKNEVFIIGGGQLYKQTMDMIDRVYLTRIHREIDGDTCYGPLSESSFKLLDSENHSNGTENYSFMTFEKL